MDQGKSKIHTGNQSMELEISKKSQNFNAAKLWLSVNPWVDFRRHELGKSKIQKAAIFDENTLN